MKKKLITISGPTASGKTSLSLKLAEHLNCSIISCDSRQFYKEMSIGTAVPLKNELKKIDHYCIQHKSIKETYTIGDFKDEAHKILKKLFKNNDFVIMTGGSGLYMDSVVSGLDDFPKIDPVIREGLNKNFKSNGIIYLQKKLKELDPKYYSIVDLNNHRRIIRALEVCISEKQPYSNFLNKKNKTNNKFKTVNLSIETNRVDLYKKINSRVDQMIEYGLVEEVNSLYKYKHLNPLNTVGYKEIFDFIDGKSTLIEAIDKIKQNTRRYAKRQLTWLKKRKLIWVNKNIKIEELKNIILSSN
ncbi:MAG: tRNA (adenosine(37)-N6)-dimethylallyltransferase MiaA [Flavobacteriales bacterium]|nr:MAG: tRNA (adenosine(37)-N6)-dimethylallyltransferase MiaA [Flavobacteriales bacterium]